MEYTNSRIRELIAEYIHSERDRQILTRRLIDGITLERLAEEFDIVAITAATRTTMDLIAAHMTVVRTMMGDHTAVIAVPVGAGVTQGATRWADIQERVTSPNSFVPSWQMRLMTKSVRKCRLLQGV